MAHCSELNPRKITLSWLIMVFPWRMLQPSTGHMCATLCSPASKSLWGLNWECTEKLAAAVIYWSCPPPILQLHWILIFQYEGSVRVKWVNAQHDRYLYKGNTCLTAPCQIGLKTTHHCDIFTGLCQWPAFRDQLRALRRFLAWLWARLALLPCWVVPICYKAEHTGLCLLCRFMLKLRYKSLKPPSESSRWRLIVVFFYGEENYRQ